MIPDSILRRVTKPARYTGGEWNSTVKDWETAEVKVALAYPDVYEVGMSNLAIGILYDILNAQPGVLAERVYAPWVDLEAEMRQAAIPLHSLESKRPLAHFDILGFSLGYELTFTNVLNMLDLAQIPVKASERNDSHPLVIAGGSCALNPEPMADFLDLFVLGDGEEVILELVRLFQQWKKEGSRQKREFLRQAAKIPGIYVPAFYEVSYHPDGTVSDIAPTIPEAPRRVIRCLVQQLLPPLTRPVVPYLQVIHDRGAIEIQRGCTRGCRFCQAGMIYRPCRERPPEEILTAVDGLIRNCGYEELSLVSLNSSDYHGIENLVKTIAQRYQGKHLSLSLPSLRLDTFSVELADSLPGRRKTGFTFAPEAGTERLRRVINKCIPEDELARAVHRACNLGWSGLKLYFMAGLPTETQEDIEGIVRTVREFRRLSRSVGRRELQVRVSVTTFVPKPHTPFQWLPQNTEEMLQPKIELLKAGLRRTGAHLSWEDPQVSQLEAVMARGDRRLGAAIHRAWKLGAVFDAWRERFQPQLWLTAFQETGLSPAFYANRDRPLEEYLPWSPIDIGVSTGFLKREYQRSLVGEETADCRGGACAGCGLEHLAPGCQHRFAQSSVQFLK